VTLQTTEIQALVLTLDRRAIEIATERTYEIGRHATNDMVINDVEISRFHARISWREGVPVIEDLGSVNGTFVDGLRLHGPSTLRAGQRLMIGSLKINVDVLEVQPDPALLHEPTGDLSLFNEWQIPEIRGNFRRQLTFHRFLLDLEAEGRTGTLELALGVRRATVVFKLGLVAAATLQGREGMGALERILRTSVGTYRFRPSFEPQDQSMDLSVRHLLREGPWASTRRHHRRAG
jgi:pSer/pThr/pTyr-binding forkhead associated (FHA) protein